MRSSLLLAAADALEDGQDPFSQSFLVDNDVSFDECMALSDALALGVRLVAFLKDNPDLAIGAIEGANLTLAYKNLNTVLSKM